MRGQEAVLSALGHKRLFYRTHILSAGTRNVPHAMETHGVRRLVCMSSLGIGDSAGRPGLFYTLLVIPLILPFYFRDKTRQGMTIARRSLDWTIVRPGVLTNGIKRGRARHGARVGNSIWTVSASRTDVNVRRRLPRLVTEAVFPRRRRGAVVRSCKTSISDVGKLESPMACDQLMALTHRVGVDDRGCPGAGQKSE